MRLLEALSVMHQIMNNPEIKKSRDFSYFLIRNTKMLNLHYELASDIYEGTRNLEYEEYQKGLKEIHLKHAVRREDGEVIKMPNGWPMTADANARDEECRAWNEKHKEMLIAHETKPNEAMELLSVEEVYDVFPIKLEKIPEDINVTPFDMFIEENLDLYPESKESKIAEVPKSENPPGEAAKLDPPTENPPPDVQAQ